MDCEDIFIDLCRLSVVCAADLGGISVQNAAERDLPFEVAKIIQKFVTVDANGSISYDATDNLFALLYRTTDDILVCKYMNDALTCIGKKPIFKFERSASGELVPVPNPRRTVFDYNLLDTNNAVNVAAHIIAKPNTEFSGITVEPYKGYEIAQQYSGEPAFHYMLLKHNVTGWYHSASEEVKASEKLAKYAVSKDYNLLRFAPQSLKANIDYVGPLLQTQPYAVVYTPFFWNRKQLLLDAFKGIAARPTRRINIADVLEEIDLIDVKDDKDIALFIVRNVQAGLEHVSESFRNNAEIVKVALDSYLSNYLFVSSRLKRKYEFALKSVRGVGYRLIPRELWEEGDFVLAAYKLNVAVMELVPPRLLEAEGFVLKLLAINPYVLKYVDTSSERMVEIAAGYGWDAFALIDSNNQFRLKYLQKALRASKENDREIYEASYIDSLPMDPDYYDGYIDDVFRVSKGVAAIMIKRSETPMAYSYMFDEILLRKPLFAMYLKAFLTREQIIAVMNRYGSQLDVFKEYNDDLEIVLVAVSNDGLALNYASSRLKDSALVVKTAIENKKEALRFASARQQERHKSE